MPYDGSGNFTIINNFEEDRINGVSIDSLKMDNNFNDIANGLSNVMLRSGSVVMTGILNMGDHKITNLVAGTSSKDAVNKGQMDTALAAKQNTITGGATTITSSNLTANRALISSSSGKVAVSDTTSTELGYVHGVTSAVQTQINAKAADNAVVHIAGAETITGEKTFLTIVKTNGIRQYSNNVTKGTAPSSAQYINMYMTDSSQVSGDANAMGLFRTIVNPDNTVISQLQAFKNEAGSQANGYLRVTYDTANNTYFASMGGSSSGTNLSATRETNSTAIQTIPTMGWVNNPATSTNVVHRTGDETIGGTKTFSSQAIFGKANGIQLKGTNHYYTLRSVGNTPEGCALLLDNSTSSIAFNATDDRITIGCTAIPAYAVAPTDSYSTTSGTQIATTGWVGSKFVNVAGSQTISGAKTFTSNPYVSNSEPRVFLTNSDVIRGTAPSANEVSAFQYRDNNNDLLGSVHNQYKTDKSIVTQLVAYKANNASDTASARIGVGYDASGNVITYAPACEEENSIVTTINKSKADNGYYELGNGLIIQWGSKEINGNTSATVTLPKAFTSTNYKIAVSRNTAANATGDLKAAYVRGSKTTTEFELFSGSGNQTTLWIAIGY